MNKNTAPVREPDLLRLMNVRRRAGRMAKGEMTREDKTVVKLKSRALKPEAPPQPQLVQLELVSHRLPGEPNTLNTCPKLAYSQTTKARWKRRQEHKAPWSKSEAGDQFNSADYHAAKLPPPDTTPISDEYRALLRKKFDDREAEAAAKEKENALQNELKQAHIVWRSAAIYLGLRILPLGEHPFGEHRFFHLFCCLEHPDAELMPV